MKSLTGERGINSPGRKYPSVVTYPAVTPTGNHPKKWKEVEGSGSGIDLHVDPNTLVEQLHLSLASIRAGNTSLKLKKQVEYMLGFLEAAGEITQKEVHNILRSII